MTLATIWQAIALLVKYLPTLVAAIQAGEDFITIQIDKKKLNNAEDKAEKTGDTSEIEAIFHPGSNPKP